MYVLEIAMCVCYVILLSVSGGFNDPDLLVGPNGRADGTYATELQSRTQVNLWSVIAAPLIISDNLLKASPYHMDTVRTSLICIVV